MWEGWMDYSHFSYWQGDVDWEFGPQENVDIGSEGGTLQESRQGNVDREAE
jgi:hypothetical protein